MTELKQPIQFVKPAYWVQLIRSESSIAALGAAGPGGLAGIIGGAGGISGFCPLFRLLGWRTCANM